MGGFGGEFGVVFVDFACFFISPWGSFLALLGPYWRPSGALLAPYGIPLTYAGSRYDRPDRGRSEGERGQIGGNPGVRRGA